MTPRVELLRCPHCRKAMSTQYRHCKTCPWFLCASCKSLVDTSHKAGAHIHRSHAGHPDTWPCAVHTPRGDTTP